jgi:hypothetical protein
MLMMTWCDVFDDDELLLRLMLRCVVDCLCVWRQIDIMSCPSLGMESARYAISCTPCRRCAGRIVLIDVQTGAAAMSIRESILGKRQRCPRGHRWGHRWGH